MSDSTEIASSLETEYKEIPDDLGQEGLNPTRLRGHFGKIFTPDDVLKLKIEIQNIRLPRLETKKNIFTALCA